MATGPATRIADVIVPELFTSYVRTQTEEKSRIIASGMAARSAAIDGLLAGGGLTFNIPFWNDLDNDAERIDTDTSVPFASDPPLPAGQANPPDPLKITSGQQIGVRLSRNNSWSSVDLAATLAGEDPMSVIVDRVSAYWVRRLQAAFVATWNGVLADNIANDTGDYINDLSGLNGGVFQDGLTNFSAEAFLDAVLTMGDSMDQLSGVIVHSVVYNRMQKNNLIDFVEDSNGLVNIPTFLGRAVIIDDNMPRTGSVYDTWIFGAGTTEIGIGSPQVPTEIERKPGGGNGGGQEVLYSRVQWCIHPTGHAFVGTPANGGPANTGTAGDDLDEAASWDRRFSERKMINFAVLRSREA